MCAVLQIPRSTFYYEAKVKEDETPLKEDIKQIYLASRRNYGTRKIKRTLNKDGKQVSRRRIGRIMKELGLVSSYTICLGPHLMDSKNSHTIKLIKKRLRCIPVSYTHLTLPTTPYV